MAPLWHRIVKEVTLPPGERTLDDQAGLLTRLDDVQCFEVSAVDLLARDLGAAYPQYGAPDELMFLPAAKTWIEFAVDYGRRGFLVEERRPDDLLRWDVIEAVICKNGLFRAREWAFCEAWKILPASPVNDVLNRMTVGQMDSGLNYGGYWFRAILAIINTPRIIAQRQHDPHRGLEKRLRQSGKDLSSRPWSEVLLRVAVPKEHGKPGDRQPTHMRGMVAYHYCRTHVRIRLGRLGLVTGHHRGSKDAGIIQKTYRVA